MAFVAPLNERWLGRLAGFFFALDLTGSTLIRVVILGRALHLLMWPKCANKSTWRARGQFGAITTAVVVLSAVVAAVIPVSIATTCDHLLPIICVLTRPFDPISSDPR